MFTRCSPMFSECSQDVFKMLSGFRIFRKPAPTNIFTPLKTAAPLRLEHFGCIFFADYLELNVYSRAWTKVPINDDDDDGDHLNTIPKMMAPSWELYLDDFFWFLCSSSRTCLKLVTLAMMAMMICRIIIFQTSNSPNLGSRWARGELKKGISSIYNFQNDGHHSSSPTIHV